jgi:phospholipid/cholesterol/gamma-HCH transport system substrate-binding protein
MQRKINYAMVGLFVILLGAAWLAISLWLALGDFSVQYQTYRMYLDESVSGLYLDAPVKYRGVEIGKVSEIRLNPDVPGQVQLTFDIDSTVPIKEDTIAVLTVQGLTGIAFVDLTGGSLESPRLQAKEGATYPVIQTGPSFFSRLDTSGTELMANLNLLVHGLANVVDVGGEQTLREILENIRQVTAALAGRRSELEHGVRDAARLLESGALAAGRLPALLTQVEETAQAFGTMAASVGAASERINTYVERSGAGVQQFSQQTLPELGALISELRRLADTLQGIGSRLEGDPRVLLYGRDLEVPGPGE